MQKGNHQALRNKQTSINRGVKIQLARKQEELARLKKEQAALKQGTARVSTRTKRVIEEASPEPKAKRTKQDEAETRVVIKHFYKQLRSPPEEDWGQCGAFAGAPAGITCDVWFSGDREGLNQFARGAPWPPGGPGGRGRLGRAVRSSAGCIPSSPLLGRSDR